MHLQTDDELLPLLPNCMSATCQITLWSVFNIFSSVRYTWQVDSEQNIVSSCTHSWLSFKWHTTLWLQCSIINQLQSVNVQMRNWHKALGGTEPPQTEDSNNFFPPVLIPMALTSIIFYSHIESKTICWHQGRLFLSWHLSRLRHNIHLTCHLK